MKTQACLQMFSGFPEGIRLHEACATLKSNGVGNTLPVVGILQNIGDQNPQK